MPKCDRLETISECKEGLNVNAIESLARRVMDCLCSRCRKRDESGAFERLRQLHEQLGGPFRQVIVHAPLYRHLRIHSECTRAALAHWSARNQAEFLRWKQQQPPEFD